MTTSKEQEAGKPPRSRGKHDDDHQQRAGSRKTPALTGQTLTTQYKLSYTTCKPFRQAISQLPTFTADINATENIRRQGLLILTKKAWKTACPKANRPAIRGINSRSRAHLSGSTYDSPPGHIKRDQKRNSCS